MHRPLQEKDPEHRTVEPSSSSHDSRYKTILIGSTMRVELWGGWVEGVEGGPRCIVLAASGQTFHHPPQPLSSCISLFFRPRAPTSLFLSCCPFALPLPTPVPHSFFLFFPRPPIIIAVRLDFDGFPMAARWPPPSTPPPPRSSNFCTFFSTPRRTIQDLTCESRSVSCRGRARELENFVIDRIVIFSGHRHEKADIALGNFVLFHPLVFMWER